MDLVLGKDLLETTLRQHLVVDVTGGGRVVTQSAVPAGLHHVRREAVKNLVLVVALLVEPLVNNVKHFYLDLGYLSAHGRQ